MAPAARPAPKSRTAAFRSLDHQTVGIADLSGRHCSAGGGRETESQRDTQKDRSRHPVVLPACMNPPLTQLEPIHGALGNIILVAGGKASISRKRRKTVSQGTLIQVGGLPGPCCHRAERRQHALNRSE